MSLNKYIHFGLVLASSISFTLESANAQLDLSENTFGDPNLPQTIMISHPNHATADRIVPMINILSSSLSYGLWMNQIRNGTGTRTAEITGVKHQKEELPLTQFMRINSLFDLYFTSEINKLRRGMDDKKTVFFTAISSPLERSYLDQHKKELETIPDWLSTGNLTLKSIMDGPARILRELSPVIPYALRSLKPQIDGKQVYDFNKARFNSETSLQRATQRGAILHTDALAKTAEFERSRTLSAFDGAAKLERIKNYFNLYTPIGTQTELTLQNPVQSAKINGTNVLGKGVFHFSMTLPAIAELYLGETKEEQLANALKPENWQLRPLSIKLNGSKRLTTDIALFDRIDYAASNHREKRTVTRIDFEKDYNDLDTEKLTLSFGRLSAAKGTQDRNLVPLDLSNWEDALILSGVIEDKNIGIVSASLNRFGLGALSKPLALMKGDQNRYRVKVAIHKLGLELKRPSSSSIKEAFKRDEKFALALNFENSLFKYRVFFNAKNELEKSTHENMGFKCNKSTGPIVDGLYDCMMSLDDPKSEPNFVIAIALKKLTESGARQALGSLQKDFDENAGKSLLDVLNQLSKAKALLKPALEHFERIGSLGSINN